MKCNDCFYITKKASRYCTNCGKKLNGTIPYLLIAQIFFSILAFIFLVTGSFFSALFTLIIVVVLHPKFKQWIGKKIKFKSKIIAVAFILIFVLLLIDTDEKLEKEVVSYEPIINEENISEVVIEEKLINESINETVEEKEEVKTSCVAKFLEETECQSNAIMKEFQKTNCDVTWAYYKPCSNRCLDGVCVE